MRSVTRRIAGLASPSDLLGTLLVARLLLSALLIAHDALVPGFGWARLRLWHTLLTAVFASLVPSAFQIVFLGHGRLRFSDDR
jgi:hypothetical protein